MPSSRSALDQLRERLALNGVQADPRSVASALLGLARHNSWVDHPERVADWLTQLALDVASETPPT